MLVLNEGVSPPGDLVDAMRRRGLDATIAHGAHRGLARAMVASRARGRGVLLLVRPGEIPRARELVELLPAYLPMVRCWRFDPGATPAGLAPMEPGTLPASENARWTQRPRVGAWEFRPGLMGAPHRADSDDAGPWTGPVPTARVELTDEELSLLLPDDSSSARGDAASDVR